MPRDDALVVSQAVDVGALARLRGCLADEVVQPLPDHDAYGGRGQAADKAREPQSVDPDAGRGSRATGRRIKHGGMDRVAVNREVAQLSGDLQKDLVRQVRPWIRGEGGVQPDVESSEDSGEQTRLGWMVSNLSPPSSPSSRKQTHEYEQSVYLLFPGFY